MSEAPQDLRHVMNRQKIVIDLGCGMGDHTLELAKQDMDVGVLAIDVHTAGICDIAQQVQQYGWSHVRVHLGDAIPIFRNHLAQNSIAEVHVLFPDPWPKAKHNKRRILQAELLDMIGEILVPSGWLHFVTDDDDYADHAKALFNRQKLFKVTDSDFQVPDTSYHRRALRLGHRIHTITAELR